MELISEERITQAVNKVYPSRFEPYQVNAADIAIAQAQLDSCGKELSDEIDNILSGAIKESGLPNGRKLKYFFVDKLIALKQKVLE